jgi:hypothetical protein
MKANLPTVVNVTVLLLIAGATLGQDGPQPESPQGNQPASCTKTADDGLVECCKCGSYGVRLFGDYLYLRARDAEVPYAVQSNSNLPAPGGVPVQTSRIALVDPDYSSGFRAGLGVCLDPCTELAATYTNYSVVTSDAITKVSDIQQIASLLIHPATVQADSGSNFADAHLEIDFQRADLDYRRYFWRSDCTDINWLIGLGYGQLQQKLQSQLSKSPDGLNPDAQWQTGVDFYGGGLRLGLEAEQIAPRVNMVFYAKGITSLLAGDFTADYLQTVQNNSNPGVETSWKAGRIVPTFDLEVGGGFYGPGGKLRATLGYAFGAWTNVVQTKDWIRAVQTNDYTGMSSTMTFDGLVARVEGRF